MPMFDWEILKFDVKILTFSFCNGANECLRSSFDSACFRMLKHRSIEIRIVNPIIPDEFPLLT